MSTNTVRQEELKCKDLVRDALKSRIQDIETLWNLYQEGDESDPDLGTFHEYGLSFDYVPRGTFKDQRRGYFRYQLSWGGPSEEFRFYVDERLRPTRIEFWYLNWFDGACVKLSGKRFDLMADILNHFDECGSLESEMDKAE